MPRKTEYIKDAIVDPNNENPIVIHGLQNFSGTRWARGGQRSFSIRLTKEQADYFVSEGCNVNVREPKEPGDQPTYALKIIVNFKPEGDPLKFLDPTFDVGTMTTPPKRLDETGIDLLDSVSIYYAEVTFAKSTKLATNMQNGKQFYPVYLQSAIFLYKHNHNLADRLAEINKLYNLPPMPDEPEPF